jgi:hypothetical protein
MTPGMFFGLIIFMTEKSAHYLKFKCSNIATAEIGREKVVGIFFAMVALALINNQGDQKIGKKFAQ